MSRARPVPGLSRWRHLPRRPSLFLLVPLLLAVAGCAVFEPEPLARERQALADARARWARVAATDYAFVYQADCSCFPELTREVVIHVRDGQVDSVAFVDGGAPQIVGEASFPTIPQLFDRLDAAYAEPTAVVRATFDASRGFPRDGWVDANRSTDDDEFGFVVRSVVVVAAAR